MLVSKLDRDLVLSRGCGHVGNGTGPVLVVLTLDLSLGRALDGQGQTTCGTDSGRIIF